MAWEWSQGQTKKTRTPRITPNSNECIFRIFPPFFQPSLSPQAPLPLEIFALKAHPTRSRVRGLSQLGPDSSKDIPMLPSFLTPLVNNPRHDLLHSPSGPSPCQPYLKKILHTNRKRSSLALGNPYAAPSIRREGLSCGPFLEGAKGS